MEESPRKGATGYRRLEGLNVDGLKQGKVGEVLAELMQHTSFDTKIDATHDSKRLIQGCSGFRIK